MIALVCRVARARVSMESPPTSASATSDLPALAVRQVSCTVLLDKPQEWSPWGLSCSFGMLFNYSWLFLRTKRIVLCVVLFLRASVEYKIVHKCVLFQKHIFVPKLKSMIWLSYAKHFTAAALFLALYISGKVCVIYCCFLVKCRSTANENLYLLQKYIAFVHRIQCTSIY